MMSSSALFSKVFNFQELFIDKKNFPYIVPGMQRDVVWESKHVKALWDDIHQHIQSSLMDEMFLGVIITHSPPQMASLDPTKAGSKEPMPSYQVMTESLSTGMPAHYDKIGFQNWASSLGIPTPAALSGSQLCAEINAKREPSRVIDGQQRITSICIGAKVLSEICKRKKLNSLASDLDKIYNTKSGELRILHRDSDDRLDFENIIKHHTDKDELQSGWVVRSVNDPSVIRNIYRTTLNHVWSKVRRSRKTLKLLAEWYLTNIRVVYLEMTNVNQEHLIFKAINDAGERLVASQKFKSILFHRILMNVRNKKGELVEKHIHTKWEEIEKIISPHRDPKSVTSFLKAYCRSRGCTSRDNKTLKNEDILVSLVDLLDGYTKKTDPLQEIEKFVKDISLNAENYHQLCNPSSAIAIIEDIMKPLGTRKTWDRWQDIVDLNGIYSSNGLIPLLMAIRRLKKTNQQNKCIKYILLITLFSVIPKRINVKASKIAGEYSTKWIGFIRHNQINDLKLDIQAKIVDDSSRTYKGSVEEYRTASEAAKTSGESSQKQRSTGIRAQCDYIQKKWIELMKEHIFTSADVRQIKFILRKIETLSAKGTASSWLTQYDTMEINAEHIFPKKTAWRGKKTSPWKKEYDIDSSLWPSDEGERNNLKWRLGNFILLEAGLNKGCGNKTWKGWNTSKGTTKGKPPLDFMKKPKRKISTNHGKIHWYKFKEWEHQGKKYEGSQLTAVQNFYRNHEKENHWSQVLLNKRTERLLEKAVDEKQVPEFKLTILFN